MKKLAYKRALPQNENEFLNIQSNWFSIEPGCPFFEIIDQLDKWTLLSTFTEFYEWALDNCEGQWYRYSHDGHIESLYFQSDSDRIKFILKFM